MRPELGILADDLTGATDTGLQFAKAGRRTKVSLSWSVSSPCDVIVFDTDSRARDAAQARQRVTTAAARLRDTGVHRFYKKIDSTGRGNLGAEAEAALETLGAASALICPAFPQLGRTVRQGLIRVRGVPLDQSEFARDPLWPATTASLEQIIGRQTALTVGHLWLDEVQRGPARVRSRLAELLTDGCRLIIADAESALDLRCLAEGIRQSDRVVLPVGSAGLAEWLVGWFERPAQAPRSASLGGGPILVVAGTINPVGLAQIARLVDRGAQLVHLRPERALSEPDLVEREAASGVARALRDGAQVILALVDPWLRGLDLRPLARASGLSPALATERLVGVLGRATSVAMADAAPAALVLTGGDTARAVCVALAARGLDVYREAAPGIPICLLDGGPWDGLPVVTKAGGFGDPDTLTNVVMELEAMRR